MVRWQQQIARLTLSVVFFLTLFPLTGMPARAQSGALAAVESVTCWFPAPSGFLEGKTLDCGYLVVPEVRGANNGKTVKVAFARFRSPATTPLADPVILLQGGPGGPGIEPLGTALAATFAQTLRRDFIAIDQRGVGYSLPNLGCQEFIEMTYATLTVQLTPEETSERNQEAAAACRDRLIGEGVNLSAFNNVENANDVADLIPALGYTTANLYGVSYGSTLALSVMRYRPEVLRAVVIDAIAPPQWNQFEAPIAAVVDTFERFFAACAANSACANAYPTLKKTTYDLITTLNAAPTTISIKHPTTNKTYDLLVTGNVLLSQLYSALYVTSFIPQLPAMIDTASKGDFTALESIVSQTFFQFEDVAFGMFYSVGCASEGAYADRAAIEESLRSLPPEFAGIAPGLTDSSTICASWGVGKAAEIETTPVTSTLPTLILSGELDPITPPANGALAVETLPNGSHFIFPGTGHGAALSSSCAFGILSAFVQAPQTKPDSACIEQMAIEFFTGELLTEYVAPGGAFRTVRPVGWAESSPGVFASDGGQSLFLVTSASVGKDLLTESLLNSLAVNTDLTELGVQEANGLTWTLTEFGSSFGLTLTLALAEQKGTTYVLIVGVAPNADSAKARQNYLIPAIQAFQIK
ncbi:MAG TPA: alpha/beta hydrolase [Aggregatilineales bacterium]|nr:alpha/beta hydrolase [Anaerolineales bacterium]HRE48562.1 alpha/beta hydrolase [Aggregatilineales bacterium]